MIDERPDVVVPEEASERGHILKGELRSADIRISGILVQLSKITPHNRKAKIFFYPTLEQAKILQLAPPPFSFEGSVRLQEGVNAYYRSTEIWPKHGSQITHHEMRCFTHCSGRLVDLQVTVSSQARSEEQTSKSAWFLTNQCFLLRILATPEKDDLRRLKELNIERPVHKFQISDGAVAEFRRTTSPHSFKGKRGIKECGYAIQVDGVKNSETVKKDVECLLILASLASRERSDFWYWNVQESSQVRSERWRFGMGKWPKRPDGEEPLILRDVDHCSKFLSVAFQSYQNSSNGHLLDSAVYALLSRDLTLETRIVRLFTGVQSALAFALPYCQSEQPLKIKQQYEEFEKRYTVGLTDLWPLIDGAPGASLREIRNAIVHGDAFTAESDFVALSIAAENLKWILERILLVALGWDIELSSVSARKLNWHTAHNWKGQQQSFKL
jgi:hypothetical protein